MATPASGILVTGNCDDGKMSATSSAAIPGDANIHLQSSDNTRNCSPLFLHGYLDKLQITVLEEKLIDDLGAEVERVSSQYAEMVRENRDFSILKERIEALEKDKRCATEDVLTRDGIIGSLKERISALHEQNGQLAQLAHVSGGQSEILSIRNALAASLTQLKKLQIQVDEIPVLRRQISDLIYENQTFKEKQKEVYNRFSIAFSDGIEPLTYIQLVEQNMQLKSQHAEMSKSALHMSGQIKELTKLINNLSKRVDMHRESHSVELFTSFAELDKEKESLSSDIMTVKPNQSLSAKDMVKIEVLERECCALKKGNLSLQKKLQNVSLEFARCTEAITSKMFDVELSGIHVFSSEIKKSLSDFDINLDLNSSLTSQQFVRSDGTVSCVRVLPLFESQLTKLNQLRLCRNQLRGAFCMLKSQTQEAVADPQDHVIQDFESQISYLEENLEKAHKKIDELEKDIPSSSAENVACLMKDNASLLSQVSVLTNKLKAASVFEKELSEEKNLHDVYAKKYKKAKEQKKNIEGKLKDLTLRFHEVASELSNSTALLQKYQVQCESLQQEGDQLKTDYEKLANDYECLLTQQEACKVEKEFTKIVSMPEKIKDKSMICGTCSNPEGLDLISLVQLWEHGNDLIRSLLTNYRGLYGLFMQFEMENCSKEYLLNKKVLSHHKDILDTLQHLSHANKLIQGKYEKEKVLFHKNEGIIHELQTKMHKIEVKLQNCEEEKQKLMSTTKELNHEVEGLKTMQKDKCAMMKSQKNRLQIDLAEKELQLKHILGEIEKLQLSLQMEMQNILKTVGDESEHLIFGEDTCKESIEVNLKQLEETLKKYVSIRLEYQLENKVHHPEFVEPLMSRDFITRCTQTSLEFDDQCSKLIENIKTEDQSLSEYNLQLEEQISVLSQWNDKQCSELEQLRSQLHCQSTEYEALILELQNQEELIQQNTNLQTELKEVEEELNILRSTSNSDFHEELQMKVDTQAHLLTSLNENNSSLHKKVEELQLEIRDLKMKDSTKIMLPSQILAGKKYTCSIKDLTRANFEYKKRINFLEDQLLRLYEASPGTRRCILPLMVYISVPTGCFLEDLLNRVPDDMLDACSNLSKCIHVNISMDNMDIESWKDVMSSIWFACVSQKEMTVAIAQYYITAISNISSRLLDFVINLQDEMGNTALHYVAAALNFPVMEMFLNINSCNSCIVNNVGYNPLMVLSDTKENFFKHRQVIDTLIKRTEVNPSNKENITSLMVAAASGNTSMISLLLPKYNIQAEDKYGATALMYAVECTNIIVIKQLLDTMQCNVQHKDKNGCTAIDVAKAKANEEIVSLLLNYLH